MFADSQITMSDLSGISLVIIVALAYLGIRLLPRLIAGFNAYISPIEVKRRLEKAEDILLLDLRSDREFRGHLGHIAGSINIPLDTLRNYIANNRSSLKEKPRRIVVICHTGTRAAFAMPLFKRAGIRDVRVINGGLVAWLEQELPVHSSFMKKGEGSSTKF